MINSKNYNKLVEALAKEEAKLAKANAQYEKFMAAMEDKINKQVEKEYKNHLKIYNEEYNGTYSKEMFDKEWETKFIIHNRLVDGLNPDGTFSWETWRTNIREHFKYWENLSKERREQAIKHNKEKIASLLERIEKEKNKEEKRLSYSEENLKKVKKIVDNKIPAALKEATKEIYDIYYREFIAKGFTEKESKFIADMNVYFLMYDLLFRIAEYKIGEIKDVQNLRVLCSNGRPVLIGTFVGENKTIRTKIIMAGGYNVQRLHNRVIIIDC